MKTGIFVCGRDINLPLPEWERLMWGEAPNKMGSLPMAVKLFLDDGGDLASDSMIVLGNGCIPGKNELKEIGFTTKYLFENISGLTRFE